MFNKKKKKEFLTIKHFDKQQLSDYNFYKKLGYSEAQSLTLAAYAFMPYSWSFTSIDDKILKTLKERFNSKKSNQSFSEFFVENYLAIREEIKKEVETESEKIKRNTQPKGAIMRSNSVCYSMSPTTVEFSCKKESRAIAAPELSVESMECECNFDEGLSTFEMPILPPQLTDTESYAHIEEKGFVNVSDSPTSSFRTTCNTASIGTLMNQIRNGRYVKPSSVRIEELMNFFDYDIKDALDDRFNIHVELCNKPNSNNKLLFVGIKGQKIIADKQNVVILLDASGSMSSNDTMTKKSIMSIVANMHDGDTLSLVTYSSEDFTIFDGWKIDKSNIDFLIEKFYDITICGCTNGSAGIETAYKIAASHFIDGGLNKVVLITDGDLNFGINHNDGLEKLILEKKKTGVFLSVIGMGIGNFKDDKLEILAKNGNGNYCVINTNDEIEEQILNRYYSFMHVIAKDVKAQVEFNPAKVQSYRLLGYENRTISRTEFNDDKVIAEPFGCGSVCVALYELELNETTTIDSGLKYQTSTLVQSNEYCTVSVRYKLPLEDKSELLSKPVEDIGDFTSNIKLAFVCYAIGEKFRDSKFNDLKDELMARYIVETFADEKLEQSNGDKLQLLKFLAKTNH